MMKQLFAAACLAASTVATCDVEFTQIGSFDIKHPAFLNVQYYDDAPDEKFLLVSQFKAVGNGSLSVVSGITEAVEARDASTLSGTTLNTGTFKWPNDVRVVPYDVFNQRAIVVPDGFLVPGHSNGGVYIVSMDDTDITKTGDTVKISNPDETGFFYHMGYWIDMNSDGRKDFLTARSNAKEGEGALLWLEQPAEGITGTWTEHVVCTGCADVGITVLTDDSPYADEMVVFAAEFFNEAVSFTLINKSNGEFVERRVIDDQNILSAYMVNYSDINGDGINELLVNNHETDDSLNGVYAYQFPSNWMAGTFTQVTIASEFQNAFSLTVPNMSPGFVYPFFPQIDNTNEAAHLLIAGDGDYTAHIMTPTDPSNYQWDLDTIKQNKGTVGALCFADLDGDGWQEVWVPDYDNGFIELYNFAPTDSSNSNNASEFLQ